MSERKLIIEVGIDDDAVNGIVDLEREILAQNICGPAARKYLDLNSFDFPPYIKKISLSSLHDLFLRRGECPCNKILFSLSIEPVGGTADLFRSRQFAGRFGTTSES